MSYSVFILLMFTFAPFLMTNGKPAESTDPEINPTSRESRQMLLPHQSYYYVPYAQYYQKQPQLQQPMASFHNYDYLYDSLDSDSKQRFLSAFFKVIGNFQGDQAFDLSSFKSQTNNNEVPIDLSAFFNEEGKLPFDLQNVTPEKIKELVESRIAFGAIANYAVQYAVQIVIQIIWTQIMSLISG